MNTNKITQAIATMFLVGVAGSAAAQDREGWYLGAGAGSAQATVADKEIIADLENSGYEVTNFSTDERDLGYKLFAGYQFNDNFALEGGYFNLGSFDYKASTIPTGSQMGELDFSGWNLDLLGILPMTERSSLFARIGAHRGKASVDYFGTGAVNILTPSYEKSSTDYKFGIGYQYYATERFTVRLEAERYRMDDAVENHGDIDLFSLNFMYRFGGRSYAATTPVREPQPALASTESYCSELEIQFEIANDDIERVNREHMLVLATFLKKYPTTKAVIEGHTDSVGSEADNLRLSQQRAQGAVDYLAREFNIKRDRIEAVGYGETRPIAANSTDEGMQANRRINAVIGCATDIEGLHPLPARITLAMELEFDTNSSRIDPKYHNRLSSVAKYLQTNPELTATLEGHTDNASPDIAQRISRERAQSVADYLVNQFKIDRSRLSVEGFAGTRRDTYNITAAERQKNRRVSIILGYPK